MLHLERTALFLQLLFAPYPILGWLHANWRTITLLCRMIIQVSLGKTQQLLVLAKRFPPKCFCLSWSIRCWNWEKFHIYQLNLDRRVETFWKRIFLLLILILFHFRQVTQTVLALALLFVFSFQQVHICV